MAVPTEPLRLSLPAAGKMKLDDLELFEDGGFTVKGFKAFIARYSNWTAAQVGQLEIDEMKEVVEQIGATLRESAVPKGN